MAVDPPDQPATPDPLELALRAARGERHEGWVVLSEAILARVRSVAVPAYPVLARAYCDGSRTYVSTRVLTTALRRLLQRQATHAPAGLRLHVDDERLTGIDVALVAAYGVDLALLAATVRVDVLAELEAQIGPAVASVTAADVSVEFVDVVAGDPRLV